VFVVAGPDDVFGEQLAVRKFMARGHGRCDDGLIPALDAHG
jgi:hypothetical protein